MTKADMETPILMDEIQSGAYLGGISPKTLQAWRVRGKGPVFRKIGRLCRYLKSDLDDYIAKQARQRTGESDED